MKKIFLYFVMCLMLVWSFCACQGQTPLPTSTIAPTPILEPVWPLQVLSPANIVRMQEKVQLVSEVTAPIAELAFANNGQDVVLIIAPAGDLQRWSLQDRVMVFRNRLGDIGLNAASFDINGNLIAVGGGTTRFAQINGVAAERKGVEVWSTQQSMQVFNTSSNLTASDVVLSRDGQWLVEIGGGYSVYDVMQKDELTSKTIIFSDLDDKWQELTVGALDTSGEWIAYAFENGSVVLEAWQHATDIKMGEESQKSINSAIEDTPLAMAFDPSRSYLAVVMSKHLLMWDLQSQSSKKFCPLKLIEKQHTFTVAADVVFSPDGSLMAVGTGKKWQIWSVEDQKLLVEHPQGAFAVAFSPDGRLFAWGDTEGVVHIWGVPDEQ